MGNMQAEAYAEGAAENPEARDVYLLAHLQSNHFPPVHPVFLPVAKEAIERANAGDWDHEITMPNDVVLTVSEIVSQLHLSAFLDPSDE